VKMPISMSQPIIKSTVSPALAALLPTTLPGLLDVTDDGIVVVSPHAEVQFANAAARAILGLPAADQHPQIPQNPQIPTSIVEWFDQELHDCAARDFPIALAAATGLPQRQLMARSSDNGESLRWYQISAHPLPVANSSDGEHAAVVAVLTDVTWLKLRHSVIEDLAKADPLTRLPNRRLFFEQLDRAINMAARAKKRLAVCYLDLDGFKPVNDKFGHPAGDRLLQEIAQRITPQLRGGDCVGRLGGDEFAILLTDIANIEDVQRVLGRILDALRAPIMIGGDQITSVSGSVGVAVYPVDGTDGTTLIRCADQAMYIAKRHGKNRIELYDQAIDRQIEERRQLINAIAEGLKNDEFRLWFQPKVNMLSGEVIGVEALVRWQHPGRGLLSPGDFLNVIDNHDLITHLGDWVIADALKHWESWREAGLDIAISINAAPRQIADPEFYSKLQNILAAHPAFPPSHLQIEILEISSGDGFEEIREVIAQCRGLGVSFAIDDFGTGSSSLSQLRLLHVDTLKIDSTFVDSMMKNHDDFLYVQGIVAVAHALGNQVVAEGMASPQQGARLFAAGCHLVQGYGVTKPMPPEEIVPWCYQFKANPQWTDTE
jgi:diguanylate cyclase (GGDEF)-like protein